MSDERVKNEIEDIGYGLDYVMSLRPVTYFKKYPGEYSQDLQDKFYPDGDVRQARSKNEARRQVGFIAQEVRAVNEKFAVENNIVSVDEDGFHGMDYPKLIVPMVRATQELNNELKRRDKIITSQQTQIDALMKRLTVLEQQITKP